MIIGLSGKMGAGKDAVAALLSMLGYARFAFADALRAEVAAEIGNPRDFDAIDRIKPDEMAVDAILHGTVEEVYAKPTTPRMRALLQRWGTEYRRGQKESYWVDRLREKLQRVEMAAVSDVRFADEAALMRELGGEVWEIRRPGADGGVGGGHASEQINFAPDRVILNDGTMELLAQRVLIALQDAGLTRLGRHW